MKNIFPFILVIFLLFSVTPCMAAEQNDDEYFNEVVKLFEKNCKEKSNSEFLKCLAEYTPEKCKSLVYGRDRLAWKECISSCGSANIYSKTFGECSD
ncbi:hypothetical protein [Desulfosediminicola flagellatus]|uniref:hypothetical protein n=1 Tax=Desulfosediminicola flagellatus TaxID=2569541 RepID=UPI0010AC515E|nr:hypothetical protein [Desulfosediminicola flagellatus]